MNNPVIVFTSWNKHATNGSAILAASNTPHAIPNAALNTAFLVSSPTLKCAPSDRISIAKKNIAKKFIHHYGTKMEQYAYDKIGILRIRNATKTYTHYVHRNPSSTMLDLMVLHSTCYKICEVTYRKTE